MNDVVRKIVQILNDAVGKRAFKQDCMVYRNGKLTLESKIYIVDIYSKSNFVVEIVWRFLVKIL